MHSSAITTHEQQMEVIESSGVAVTVWKEHPYKRTAKS